MINNPSDEIILSDRHSKCPVLDGSLIPVPQFHVAHFKHWRLTVNAPNNGVMMYDGSIVKIVNFVSCDRSVYVIGEKFLEPSCLLKQPFNVKGILNVKSVYLNDVSELMSWPIASIKSKIFVIPYTEVDEYDENFVVEKAAIFPLLMEDKYR